MEQINEYIQTKENIEDVICKANFCLGEKAIKKFNGYCKHCFVNLFPTHPISIQASCNTKEQVVRKFINTNFNGFLHNKPIWTANCNCSHRRKIDHRKLIGNTLLCIETDENQHKGYTKKYDDFGNLDEEIRYDDIAMVHGGKFIFIRFNPDKFINHKGVKTNPILYLRLYKLKKEINKQIERIINNENEDLIEIIYLFYDNYKDEDINYDEDIVNKKNKNFNIKDEIIYNNLIEINNKNNVYHKKFMCYRCFYTSQKTNVQTHLLKNNTCKKSSLCIISDEDIDKLNKNQFSKNYKLFKNDLTNIIEKIKKNFKYYKIIHQPKYIFNCYNCFYGTNIQKLFLNHFNKQNVCNKNKYNTFDTEEINNLNISQINNNIYEINKCKCSEECKYTEEECKLLNHSQFDKNKYDILKKCYIFEKIYTSSNNKKLKNYKCYKCDYTSQKSNIINHFNRKNSCQKSIKCIFTDKECEILNQSQFSKNENAYEIIKKCNIFEKNYTSTNEKDFKNYCCFKCGYSAQKSNVLNHFKRKKVCSRSPNCKYSDEDIEFLNKHQFDKHFSATNIAENISIENQNINNITNNHITNNITINFPDKLLIDFSKQGDQLFNSRINEQKNFINQKLSEYQNNKETQNKIRNLITDIFVNKKEIAISNQKSFLKDIEISNEY